MQYPAPFASFRLTLLAASLTCCGFFHVPLFAEGDPHALLLRVKQAETERDAAVVRVVSTRKYVLRNPRWDSEAQMEVRVTSQPGMPKTYEVLRMENADGLRKKIFMKLLDGEVEASRAVARDAETEIGPANYDFAVIGREKVGDRDCVVLQLSPKRKSKLLIEGKAWVDPQENAIVRVQGRTARSISFWIGRPQITHSFRKVEDVWLLSENESVSDVKFLGRTQLAVQFGHYDLIRGKNFASNSRVAAFD